MIPEFKKILFTTNLTPESRHAFDYAISLANKYGATITILHVMEEAPQSTKVQLKNILGEERWRQLKESHEQEAKQILIGKQKEGIMIKEALQDYYEDVQKDHDECEFLMDEIVITSGVVVDEILHEAQQRDCDVIVMGYHVRGKFEEAIAGSTTRRVLRRSKIPAMLVRLPESGETG
jgi:nucleotide-binding universal stress UspA family protein